MFTPSGKPWSFPLGTQAHRKLLSGGLALGDTSQMLPRENLQAAYDIATKIGYEVSFTRHFYKPQPLRTLEEISADILAIEKEAEGLLDGLLICTRSFH